MPTCKKFRLGPLENEEDLELMFSGATCTNASAMAPGADELLAACVKAANVDNDDDVVEVPNGANDDKQARKRGAAHKSPVKKSKKNFRDTQFKRFVDLFVEKDSSRKSSATSTPIDVVRDEIAEMLESVIKAATEEGSDEHFYATQLLIKKEYKDVFATLKKPEGKLAWLRRTWKERKKH